MLYVMEKSVLSVSSSMEFSLNLIVANTKLHVTYYGAQVTVYGLQYADHSVKITMHRLQYTEHST